MAVVDAEDLNVGPICNRWHLGRRVYHIQDDCNSVLVILPYKANVSVGRETFDRAERLVRDFAILKVGQAEVHRVCQAADWMLEAAAVRRVLVGDLLACHEGLLLGKRIVACQGRSQLLALSYARVAIACLMLQVSTHQTVLTLH